MLVSIFSNAAYQKGCGLKFPATSIDDEYLDKDQISFNSYFLINHIEASREGWRQHAIII